MSKKVIFKIVIGLFVTFIILLSFLPLIVRKIAISNSKEWVGRSISLEKFKLNYFTGTIKLIDFKMYEADDTGKFVAFDTLIIDTEPYRLVSNELVIERLYLKGLDINVVMKDSTFNFDDLITRFGAFSADTSGAVPEENPMIIELSNLELNDGLLTILDAAIEKEVELRNLDFFIPYIRLDQSATSEAGLKFDFKNGGYFQSQIDIDPIGGNFDAELIIKDLDISGYDDFVAKYIDLGPFVGETDLDLKLTGNINSPEETIVSGSFLLYNFELKNNDKPMVGIKQLNIRLQEADPAHNRYVLDTIRLSQPYVYFELYDSTNNLVEFINWAMPPGDTLERNNEETIDSTFTAELFYALNNFIIDDGKIDILDRRTGEPFKYHLTELALSTDSISSKATWIETQSHMLLNDRGKLIAEVGINPSNPMDVSVDYTITDFMLSDLNIYSRHYMGFPILYGDMYYKAHTSILDGQITSENKLIIHNVELGNKGGGLYDLPLKFALFLLKDKDGVITLDVPVRGDLKDPKVSIGKIVWNTFKNLIIKAAAAPVKLLSGLIGADPKDLASIDYDYLDTVFTEKRQRQLDLLLQLEQEKPDLEIELIYLNDPELEKNEIAKAEAGKVFMEKKKKDYQVDNTGFEAFVRAEVKSDTMDMLKACRQLVEKSKIDSLFDQYNRERISDIEHYLTRANDSTEIVVIREKPDAPKNLGSKPIFDVKYGMKEEKLP